MRKIKEEIYNKCFSGRYEIRVSDLPTDLEPDDIIEIEYVDSYFSENHSYDDHTYLKIYRERDETEDERTERLERIDNAKKLLEKIKHQEYLALKAIYENGDKKEI